MNDWLPQARHRGFLPGLDPVEGEAAEYDSAEGVVIRVRIRPRLSRVARRVIVAAATRGGVVAIKSASGTGSRRPLRTRR